MDSGCGGLGYASLGAERFKQIRTYFPEKCREKQLELAQEKIDELLDYMIADSSEFYKLIASTVHNSHNGGPNYWDVPIFRNIDPQRFFSVYKRMPNVHKRDINDAFKERYRHINHHNPHLKVENRTFLGELDFMKGLHKLIDEAVSGASSSLPSTVHLKHLKNDGLKFAIEELEQFVESCATEK